MSTTQYEAFSIIAKPTSAKCNIRCEYCFYLEKSNLYTSKHTIISDELLYQYIKQFIEQNKQSEITMCWQGGEPTLLGLATFQKIVNWQQQLSNGKVITNTLQTNGTLINEEWATFLATNNFLVGISLDGTEELHNKYRKFKDGSGSFSKVMHAIELFQKYNVQFNILTVLHNENVNHAEEIYHFYKNVLQVAWWQFIPLNETMPTKEEKQRGFNYASPLHNQQQSLCSFTPTNKEYASFMIILFDLWFANDIGKIMIRFFENLFMRLVGHNNGLICYFSKDCGNNAVLEYNGDVYSCDHYVYDEFKLGNIEQEKLANLVLGAKQTEFLTSKSQNLSSDCKNCNFLTFCYGGCPKHRFAQASTGEYNQNRLCSAYKAIFSYTLPILQKFAIQHKFIT